MTYRLLSILQEVYFSWHNFIFGFHIDRVMHQFTKVNSGFRLVRRGFST
jgi:hypothetical protein